MTWGQANKRLLLLLVALAIVFAVLMGRAFYLQVVLASEYSEQADRQHLAEQTVPVKRGVIYDRDGNELAVSTRTASVVAHPPQIEDPVAVSAGLAAVLLSLLFLLMYSQSPFSLL